MGGRGKDFKECADLAHTYIQHSKIHACIQNPKFLTRLVCSGLWVGGRGKDFKECADLAREAIDNGKALKVFNMHICMYIHTYIHICMYVYGCTYIERGHGQRESPEGMHLSCICV